MRLKAQPLNGLCLQMQHWLWQQRRAQRASFLISALFIASLTYISVSSSFLQPRTPSLHPYRKPVPARTLRRCSGDDEMVEQTIEMKALIDGSVGVAISKGKCTVSSLKSQVAFMAGWRVNDDIIQVNSVEVTNNKELRNAVQRALRDHETGEPLRFVVRRRKEKPPPETTRAYLHLMNSNDDKSAVDLKKLIKQVLEDTPTVLFTKGPPILDGIDSSATACEALMKARVAYKIVDCGDELLNSGVRNALEDIIGTRRLPQLFVGGTRVGDGAKIQELLQEGKLRKTIMSMGALDFEDEVTFSAANGDLVSFKINQRGLVEYYKDKKRVYTYLTMVRIETVDDVEEIHFKGVSLITRKRSVDIRVRPDPALGSTVLLDVMELFQRRNGYLR